MPSVRILILNYNGRPLLEKYLPSFERAVKKSKYSCSLGVVDNSSTDDSISWLTQNHPGVSIYAQPNRVLCSYNEVAKTLNDDVLIFMNNDIDVDENFIDALVEPFLHHKDVFFVTPQCHSMQTKAYEGNKTKAALRYGVFWASSMFKGYEKHIEQSSLTFQGGFGAFDRLKFLELGGYDDLYLPGRLEDADICLRAYRKGFRCLYEPKSLVYHEGGTSFHSKFGVRGTYLINWRNTFLFMWKNFSDISNFIILPFWLPIWVVYGLFRGEFECFLGFSEALKRFPEARQRRALLKKQGYLDHSLSENKIFDRVDRSIEGGLV